MESGGWDISLVNVGTIPVDPKDLGPAGAFAGPVDCPSNVLVLRGHGQTILVDAGSGPLVALWPGAAESSLGGVDPDLLLATHLDFDHCGGFVTGAWPDGLAPAFPGRRVLAPIEAVEEARTDPSAESPSARVVGALDAAGLLDTYTDGDEPAPGLRFRSAPGHRAGHSILEVGDSFVYAADVFHHTLQVEHPDWDSAFDSDPELGLATRLAVLDELAERNVTTAVAHVAGPGRIDRKGDGFRWVDV